jgi:hypothetical protein
MSYDVDNWKRPREQAFDVVKTWDDEDRRFFADWMTGYDPDAVMAFELSSSRRHLERRRPGDPR